MKHPEKCGRSMIVFDTYICRVGSLPCERMKKCALEQTEDFYSIVKEGLTAADNHAD